MASEADVKAVKRQHSAQLLSKPGVTGVGVEQDETGDFVLVVHIVDESALGSLRLPPRIDGVTVRPIVTGQYGKQESDSETPRRKKSGRDHPT